MHLCYQALCRLIFEALCSQSLLSTLPACQVGWRQNYMKIIRSKIKQKCKSTCPLVTKLFELNKHLTCSQWCRTTQSAVVCRESFSVWITPWTEPAGWYHLPRSNLQKETRGPFRTRKTGIHTLTGHKQEVQYCPGAYLLCTCKSRMN